MFKRILKEKQMGLFDKASKDTKNKNKAFYDNWGTGQSNVDSWDDYYELKKSAKKDLDKGNISRKEYDKILRDAEDKVK